MALDEYLVIPVFLAGILAQATLVARDRRGAAWITGLLLGGFAAAWFFNDPADRAFGVPLFTTLVFVIGFGIVFRDRLLPPTSVRTLLHYTALVGYAAWQSLADRVHPSPFVLAVGATPFVALLVLNFVPRIPRALRVIAYAWYLLTLIFLVPYQISIDQLKAIFDSSGFSPALYAYAFFSGTVFLFFAAHVIHLIMLLPLHRTRRDLFDLMLGTTPTDVSGNTATAMAGQFSHRPMRPTAWTLLLAHIALLLANPRWLRLDDDLLINGSIAILAWGATARRWLAARSRPHAHAAA